MSSLITECPIGTKSIKKKVSPRTAWVVIGVTLGQPWLCVEVNDLLKTRHDPVMIDKLTTNYHPFIAMDVLQQGHINNFRQDSMLCSSCGKLTKVRSLLLDLSIYKIEGNISRLDCNVCNNFVAIQTDDHVIKIDEIDGGNEKDFWHEAKTTREKIIYYTLSQIIYPELDAPDSNKFESAYDFADESDLVMIRWKKGVPIGFYTLKPKGTKLSEIIGQEYAMPTLDTAYVRSKYRGQGIGTEILDNITEMFPDDDIGFSTPISDGMCKVLNKFLTAHKNYRFKFWEIKNCGEEGDKKLVWFVLKKKKTKNGGKKEGK